MNSFIKNHIKTNTYKNANSNEEANAHDRNKRNEKIIDIRVVIEKDRIGVIGIGVGLSDLYAARMADKHGRYVDRKGARRAHLD